MIDLPVLVAGQPSRGRVSLAMIAVPPDPSGNLEPYIARLKLHIRYPGCAERVEVLADLPLGIRDYDTDGPGPSLLRPHAEITFRQTAFEVAFPALWPGSYQVSCALAPERAAAAPLARREEATLTVSPNMSWRRAQNDVPLWRSNLACTIYRPAIDYVDAPGGKSKIFFTLRYSGYPVCDSERAAGRIADTAALADAVQQRRAVIADIGASAGRAGPGFIFGPVYSSAQKALIAAPVRENSRKFGLLGQGTMNHALQKARTDEDRSYECSQVIKTAIEALEMDPNNLSAYLWISVAHLHRREWGPMLDFFATLYGRLLYADRVLAENRPAADLERSAVVTTVREYLPAGALDRFTAHARELGLGAQLDTRFASLRRA